MSQCAARVIAVDSAGAGNELVHWAVAGEKVSLSRRAMGRFGEPADDWRIGTPQKELSRIAQWIEKRNGRRSDDDRVLAGGVLL